MTSQNDKNQSANFLKEETSKFSSLKDHKKEKGKLIPPLLNTCRSWKFLSWRDNGLPDMLWATILRSNLSQNDCLSLFRKIINNACENLPHKKDSFITHSALSLLSEEQFDILMSPILNNSDLKNVLSAILFFQTLPDNKHWLRYLGNFDPNLHEKFLTKAVAACLNPYSIESTDIKWFKVVYSIVVKNNIFFSSDFDLSKLKEINCYPKLGDQKALGARIRALELILRTPREKADELLSTQSAEWEINFWKEGFEKTSCYVDQFQAPDLKGINECLNQFYDIYNLLTIHYQRSISTTAVDAKLEGCFGIILYSLYLTSMSLLPDFKVFYPESRITLRVILENFITLKYLCYKNDSNAWLQFRNYGSGQAKLSFLKNIKAENLPSFLNLEDLYIYANEDMWQEFTIIEIKPWSQKNLRDMAEEVNIKNLYDKYYDWTSAFVHGNWGAIRDSIFTICLNPLHRYHRIPVSRLNMPSILPDVVELINMMLELLHDLYPPFNTRIIYPATIQPCSNKENK